MNADARARIKDFCRRLNAGERIKHTYCIVVLEEMRTFLELRETMSVIGMNYIREYSCRKNVISIVLAVLKLYPFEHAVQSSGMGVISHLTAEYANNQRLMVQDEQGIEQLVGAMDNFPVSEDVQTSGCYILSHICGADRGVDGDVPSDRSRCIAAGAIEAVGRAMRKFTQHTILQTMGRLALVAISCTLVGEVDQE
jgi:hypothetical protein